MIGLKKLSKGLAVGVLLTGFVFTGLFSSGCTHTTQADSISTEQQQYKQLLNQTIDLAKKGYVINTEKEEIKLGSFGTEVKKKFGEPDNDDSVYYVYSKKNLEFYLDETDGTPENKKPVVTIATTDKRYEKVTYQQVTEALKGYKKESENKGDDGNLYVTYQVGSNYLSFIFIYDKNGQNPDTIKEVSVHQTL